MSPSDLHTDSIYYVIVDLVEVMSKGTNDVIILFDEYYAPYTYFTLINEQEKAAEVLKVLLQFYLGIKKVYFRRQSNCYKAS